MSSKKGESNKRARADEDGDGKACFYVLHSRYHSEGRHLHLTVQVLIST